MISKEKMVDLVDFVLRFFNCKRNYSICILKDTSFKQFLDHMKTNVPSFYDRSEEEHGVEFARGVQGGELDSPCYVMTEVNLEMTKSYIVIFEKCFNKFPRLLQMWNMIHEARHIAEFPNVPSDEECGQLDTMLLKEYLKGGFPVDYQGLVLHCSGISAQSWSFAKTV